MNHELCREPLEPLPQSLNEHTQSRSLLHEERRSKVSFNVSRQMCRVEQVTLEHGA